MVRNASVDSDVRWLLHLVDAVLVEGVQDSSVDIAQGVDESLESREAVRNLMLRLHQRPDAVVSNENLRSMLGGLGLFAADVAVVVAGRLHELWRQVVLELGIGKVILAGDLVPAF